MLAADSVSSFPNICWARAISPALSTTRHARQYNCWANICRVVALLLSVPLAGMLRPVVLPLAASQVTPAYVAVE